MVKNGKSYMYYTTKKLLNMELSYDSVIQLQHTYQGQMKTYKYIRTKTFKPMFIAALLIIAK